MSTSLDVREEIRFLTALCGVYEQSCLEILQVFPPTHDPDRHRLDAIVLATDPHGTRRVAIEFTKAFQGARVGRSSPAQNEAEAWPRLKDRIHTIFRPWPEVAGRCVKCEIVMVPEIDRILEAFRLPWSLKDPRGEIWMLWLANVLSGPLHDALHVSLGTKHAELAVLPAGVTAVVAYAQVDAYADRESLLRGKPAGQPGVHVEVKGLVRMGDSAAATILPRLVGIDSVGITESVSAKVPRVAEYKAVARECGAGEFWLVTVADGSSQMSMVLTPVISGVRDGIRALSERAQAKGRPFFDRVVFLAAGYWPPSHLRDVVHPARQEMSFAAFDLYG